MDSVCGSLTDVMVETHRRRHLAYLMADHGALINPDHSTNLPKQQLNRWGVAELSVSWYCTLVSHFTTSMIFFVLSSLFILRNHCQRTPLLNFWDFINRSERCDRNVWWSISKRHLSMLKFQEMIDPCMATTYINDKSIIFHRKLPSQEATYSVNIKYVCGWY